jgi:hypothetical protein
VSKTPHGPHVERVVVGQVLDVPFQDGATFARGKVVEANARYFVVLLETVFVGTRVKFEQGALGVVLVSDG